MDETVISIINRVDVGPFLQYKVYDTHNVKAFSIYISSLLKLEGQVYRDILSE